MIPRYFDTHSHPHFPQYDEDRDAMLERMRGAQVWTIAVGTGYETSEKAALLADMHDDIWATIGVHPTDFAESFDADAFGKLVSPQVVAVGECGLDYFRGERSELKAAQQEKFEAQIAFAAAHDLPLMLHVRPTAGTQDAHEDALAVLKSYQKMHGERVRGNAHFFTGSLETAKQYWGLGFTTAFPGVITFAKELEEVVREAPVDRLLSETDAPYAAPVPHRGTRNEPAFVVDVVKKMAEIRGVAEEELAAQLVENALRTFQIEPKKG